MEITFIGHAAILIEAGGVNILSDPWWAGPCFGAQWWTYPAPYVKALEGRRIDYIYISHGHHDHFHPATLHRLNRDAKVLVSRSANLVPHLHKLGFQAIELSDDQVFSLADGVTCRVMETHNDDTLMAVSDGKEVCLNLNDALHSAPASVQARFISRLKTLYPRIDYVFCGYGMASHFPNCYEIPGKDRKTTAIRRQQYFNTQWARLNAELNPRYAFPFAADVVLLEDGLFWMNELTHNSERPVDAFRALYPKSSVETFDIAPGFVIRDGEVKSKVLRAPVLERDLRISLEDEIQRTNRCSKVGKAAVQEAASLMRENIELCAARLRSFKGDYRFLVEFKGSGFGISIRKRKRSFLVEAVVCDAANRSAFDVIYTTRLSYLKRSLTVPFAEEVLFVGSGGVFAYTNSSRLAENLHLELKLLLQRHTVPPPALAGSSGLINAAKQALKRLIGRADVDLYDLVSWTEFHNERESPVSVSTDLRAARLRPERTAR